jgi:aminopeptidase N
MAAWAQDIHSYSDPEQAAVKHLDLDIGVDFQAKRLEGTATWDLRRSKESDQVVFDTRDMEIKAVSSRGKPLKFTLGPANKSLGAPLTVALPAGVDQVTVAYATRPEAAALQWLQPEQTAGGKEPFLFTQSQAVLARSWIPCQDSPAVRFTYKATVRVPKHLLALMSASNPTELSPNGEYTFDMPQAIPSYLMALAVGDLRFAPLGKVCGIYAEPGELKAAAYEFAETEKMVVAVEKMYGPYRWGRYDMLVLPPSFPFGGMENPRLTFLTPTVIAGDRSLTSLVAHELAHSWSGNLVTNSTWNDFWLNEGFTVYLERRIMEEVYGQDYAQMLINLGFDDLRRTLADTPPVDTHLKLDLTGRDPDEGLTDIAYEKGYFFLTYLESQVGRERFDQFLRAHFDDNAFQSLDTEAFLVRVKEQLGPDLEVDAWVYGPGLPEGFTVAPSARFVAVDQALQAYQKGSQASELDSKNWSTAEWLRFLRGLPNGITLEQMEELDAAFAFTQSGNSEILAQWLVIAIQSHYQPAYPALESFLVRVGRRKFLEPLYEEMIKTEEGKVRARAIYKKARPNYHSVAVRTMDELLGWPY